MGPPNTVAGLWRAYFLVCSSIRKQQNALFQKIPHQLGNLVLQIQEAHDELKNSTLFLTQVLIFSSLDYVVGKSSFPQFWNATSNLTCQMIKHSMNFPSFIHSPKIIGRGYSTKIKQIDQSSFADLYEPCHPIFIFIGLCCEEAVISFNPRGPPNVPNGHGNHDVDAPRAFPLVEPQTTSTIGFLNLVRQGHMLHPMYKPFCVCIYLQNHHWPPII